MRAKTLALATAVLAMGVLASAAKAAIPDGIIDSVQVGIPGIGNINIVASLGEADGAVTVCGLYFFDEGANGTTKSVANQVLRSIQFSLDGKGLGISASKFKLYPTQAEAEASQELTCKATKRAADSVKKPNSFKIKLNSGSVVQY